MNMLEDPRKRQNSLPLPVTTTGAGSYTAGTPIPSRTAQRGATPVTRVDLPFLEPAAPVTKYRQSNVQADRTRQRQVAPPLPPPNPPPSQGGGQGGGRPGTGLVRAAQAATGPARTTPGVSKRYFQAQPPALGGRTTPVVAPAAPLPAAPAAPGTRPPLTQQAVQLDLAQPGSLPLLPGQGYFRNNTTEQVSTLDSPAPQKTRATAALPAQPGQPAVEPGRRPVRLPRLNPNLSTGDALADFIGQAASAGETIAGNRAVAGAEKRTRQGFSDEQDALKSDLEALTALKGLRAPPTTDQIKATRAQELLAQNPAEFTATDRLLFGDRTSTNRRKIIEEPVLGADGFPTGAKRFYSVDPETGESLPVALPAGNNAQGGGKPADYPDAYQGRTPDGKPGWFVKRDGKTYLVSE